MAPGHLALTDDKGMVLLARPVSQLWVRAPGHGRVELNNIDNKRSNLVVRLPAVTPKALYLSVYGAGNERLLGNALKLLGETELNALVIDVKGDRGYVSYRSAVALAAKALFAASLIPEPAAVSVSVTFSPDAMPVTSNL